MQKEFLNIENIQIPVYTLDTIVIGSGCAGYNAIDWLCDLGRQDIALVTEGIHKGTSRNTGSDKQTYYKLSLASDGTDSIDKLANTLFKGGSVNGDNALIEAASSVRCFIKLANLGVPFPTNQYGEYVGYKTDHDPRQRATSAGPLTSKYMTECLEKAVTKKNIQIFDNMQIIKFITEKSAIKGALALDLDNLENGSYGFTLFNVNNIIMATGGPASVYATSVYPESQTGMTGVALEAGAAAANLQEWQYGLASTKFRWNVSGTYQQVLPKYIAVDKNGNEREFLLDYFDDPLKALDMVFLKGYQWPFDISKIQGSSIIDLIIHNETVNKGNRVYMDFRREPAGLVKGFEGLGEETYNYLKNSNALLSLPIERLAKMNSKAIQMYQSHGIDLYKEPLEVKVCAQHNNGGIAVDENWESSIKGLYVAGEAAGTFGVYRPGGSALNSTQVGSMRAAEHIAYTKENTVPSWEAFQYSAQNAILGTLKNIKRALESQNNADILTDRKIAQEAMTACCAHIRDIEKMKALYQGTPAKLKDFFINSGIRSVHEVPQLFKNADMLTTQTALLSAALFTAEQIGSRGSSLVLTGSVEQLIAHLTDFTVEGKEQFKSVLVSTVKEEDGFTSAFQPVRPIPHRDNWFENVWNEYNKRTKNL